MSKIYCKCGCWISDSTDGNPNKGLIISDKEYFNLLDMADELIESTQNNREELAMKFRKNVCVGNECHIRLKQLFQCPECGRLLLENEDGEYHSFVQEDKYEFGLLDYKGNDFV